MALIDTLPMGTTWRVSSEGTATVHSTLAAAQTQFKTLVSQGKQPSLSTYVKTTK